MKIVIKANFSTDGDYRIEGYDYSSNPFNKDIDINLSDRQFKIKTEGWLVHSL